MSKSGHWWLIVAIGLLLATPPLPAAAIDNVPGKCTGGCDTQGGGGGGGGGGGTGNLMTPEEREARQERERHSRSIRAYNDGVDYYNAAYAAEERQECGRALRDYEQAEPRLERALHLEPDSEKAEDLLERTRAAIVGMKACLAARAGNFAEAITLYRAAARLYAYDADYYLRRAEALQGEAQEQAQFEALWKQADVAHDTKDWKTAETLWRKIGTTTGSAAAWFNLGLVLGAQGKLEEALQAYREALRRNPKDAEAAAQAKQTEDRIRAQREEALRREQDARAAQGIGPSLDQIIAEVRGMAIGGGHAGGKALSAQFTGQAAVTAPGIELPKWLAGLTFDEPGPYRGELPRMAVHPEWRPDAHRSDTVIGPYRGDARVAAHVAERDQAEAEYRELGQKLQAIEATVPPGSNTIPGEAVEILKLMFQAKSQANAADANIVERVRDIKARESQAPGAPPQRPGPPSPSPAAGVRP